MPTPADLAGEVPLELRKLAIAAMTANDALPEGERDQTPDHIIAAVDPAIRAAERAKVAEELRAHAAGHRRTAARGGALRFELGRRAMVLDAEADRIARGED